MGNRCSSRGQDRFLRSCDRTAMISDLSPGDKLSLKGKIFELQKKLQIIDIRNRQKEEYSYKPTLYNYDLPDRHDNVLESINKAELIRKQRKKMLEAAVLLQGEEGCTFAPKITQKSKALMKQESRPVHIRLTEKGKDYANSIVQLREKVRHFDDQGRRLFTPAINRDVRGDANANASFSSAVSAADFSADPAVPTSPSPAVSLAPAAADEFLYQDARDREERFRMRERELQAEAEAQAGAVKMNPASLTLLRRKADRDARLAFRFMLGASLTASHTLGIDDIERATKAVCNSDKWGAEALGRHLGATWALLDHLQRGSVGVAAFLAVAVPLLQHTTLSSAAQELQRVAQGKDGEEGEDHLRGAKPNALATASALQLGDLQAFLRKVVEYAKKNEAPPAVADAFQPHIYQHSYKLASRKEQKERERIEEALALSRARSLLAERQDAPPPPPPSGDALAEEAGEEREEEKAPAEPHSASAMELSHTDIMYARALLKKQNLARIAQEVQAKEMRECTFKPTVIPVMTHIFAHVHQQRSAAQESPPQSPAAPGDQEANSVASESLAASSLTRRDQHSPPEEPQQAQAPSGAVHDRLYSLKGKVKAAKLAEPSARMIEEMQACTFQPQLRSSFSRRKTAGAPVSEKAQRVEEKSVQRIRAVHEQKLRKAAEESHEAQQERLNRSYAHSRELARRGVVPFHFQLEERLPPPELKSAEASPVRARAAEPDLIVDVKLSAAKTAKIAISRGDDPRELASSFARIYSLDQKAQGLLAAVIVQSMTDNGLLPIPEEAAGEGEGGLAGAEGTAGAGQEGYEDALLGQDALYVDDDEEDYDSESSVSDSLEGSGGSAQDEEEEGEGNGDGSSVSVSGQESAYLTA